MIQPSQIALDKARTAWTKPSTQRLPMNSLLAEAFAGILDEVWDRSLQTKTTDQLLDEIRVRVNQGPYCPRLDDLQKDVAKKKCETCQEESTAHIEAIGCHFCASCLQKIDARIVEINLTKHEADKRARLNPVSAPPKDELSIRDQVALSVLNGLVVNNAGPTYDGDRADRAFHIADRFLAARKKVV